MLRGVGEEFAIAVVGERRVPVRECRGDEHRPIQCAVALRRDRVPAGKQALQILLGGEPERRKRPGGDTESRQQGRETRIELDDRVEVGGRNRHQIAAIEGANRDVGRFNLPARLLPKPDEAQQTDEIRHAEARGLVGGVRQRFRITEFELVEIAAGLGAGWIDQGDDTHQPAVVFGFWPRRQCTCRTRRAGAPAPTATGQCHIRDRAVVQRLQGANRTLRRVISESTRCSVGSAS